jgi:hypothetical protein
MSSLWPMSFGVRVKVPCHGCKDRTATCHRAGECKRWADYLKEREDRRNKIIEGRRREGGNTNG